MRDSNLIDELMELIPDEYRHNWCFRRKCSNFSYSVNTKGNEVLRENGREGISFDEWQQWLSRHNISNYFNPDNEHYIKIMSNE